MTAKSIIEKKNEENKEWKKIKAKKENDTGNIGKKKKKIKINGIIKKKKKNEKGKVEKKVNEFYDIVSSSILHYIRKETDKEKANGTKEGDKQTNIISHERIKIYIQDLIYQLHSSNFYAFNKIYESSDVTQMSFPQLKFVSFTLFPQKFNKNLLHICKKCTLLFCEIYDNIACDIPFLLHCFEKVKETDDFLNKLLSICKHVYYNNVIEEGQTEKLSLTKNQIPNKNELKEQSEKLEVETELKQKKELIKQRQTKCREIEHDIRCIIGRSDYMMDADNEKIEMKQTEYNTISVSCGSLSIALYEAQKVEIKKLYKEYFSNYDKYEQQIDCILEEKFKNTFLSGVTNCFVQCHYTYLRNYKPLFSKNRVISLCIIQKEDTNQHDKLKIKAELNKLGITQIYLTLEDLQKYYQKKKIFLNYHDETIEQSLNRLKTENDTFPVKNNENEKNAAGEKKNDNKVEGETENDIEKETKKETECETKANGFRPGKLIIDLSDDNISFSFNNETCEKKNYKDGTKADMEGSSFFKPTQCLYEISIVYFRSLYTPKDFNDTMWIIREMIEFSDAVKIPSIPYQLIGFKRMQMLLTDDEILKKYISLDANKRKKTEEKIEQDIKILKSTFALQVDPSLESNASIVEQAIQNEKQFILKPQREGGLNNLYDEEMKNTLSILHNNKQMKNLSTYVLMKKMSPTIFQAVHCKIKENEDKNLCLHFREEPSISEICLYHNFLFDKTGNIFNDQEGYFVKTKQVNENEGGVSCGISCVDSLFLI